jgi:hypothetical protein
MAAPHHQPLGQPASPRDAEGSGRCKLSWWRTTRTQRATAANAQSRFISSLTLSRLRSPSCCRGLLASFHFPLVLNRVKSVQRSGATTSLVSFFLSVLAVVPRCYPALPWCTFFFSFRNELQVRASVICVQQFPPALVLFSFVFYFPSLPVSFFLWRLIFEEIVSRTARLYFIFPLLSGGFFAQTVAGGRCSVAHYYYVVLAHCCLTLPDSCVSRSYVWLMIYKFFVRSLALWNRFSRRLLSASSFCLCSQYVFIRFLLYFPSRVCRKEHGFRGEDWNWRKFWVSETAWFSLIYILSCQEDFFASTVAGGRWSTVEHPLLVFCTCCSLLSKYYSPRFVCFKEKVVFSFPLQEELVLLFLNSEVVNHSVLISIVHLFLASPAGILL